MSKKAKQWHEEQMAEQEYELDELRQEVEELKKENERLKNARGRRGAGAAGEGTDTFNMEVMHAACTVVLSKFKNPSEFKSALTALNVNTRSTTISTLRKELVSAILKM